MFFMSRGFTLLFLCATVFVLMDKETRLFASGLVTSGYAHVIGGNAPVPLERPPMLALADLDDCLRGTGRVTGGDAYAEFCADLASFTSPETAMVAEGDAMPVERPERASAFAEDDAKPVCAATLPPLVHRNRGKTSEVIVVPHDCTVPSPADGRILYAGFFKGYLGVVILETGSEMRLTIAGLGNISVRRGDETMAGNEIGMTSDTVAPALADAADGEGAALLIVADATASAPAS
jgi:hypothetical protein